jgi:ribosome biogenesis protein Tsr3
MCGQKVAGQGVLLALVDCSVNIDQKPHSIRYTIHIQLPYLLAGVPLPL